jgi:hypothetical protein
MQNSLLIQEEQDLGSQEEQNWGQPSILRFSRSGMTAELRSKSKAVSSHRTPNLSPANAGFSFWGRPDPGVARCALTPGYLISRLQREELTRSGSRTFGRLRQVVETYPELPSPDRWHFDANLVISPFLLMFLADMHVQLASVRLQLGNMRMQLDGVQVQLAGAHMQLDGVQALLAGAHMQLDGVQALLAGVHLQFGAVRVQFGAVRVHFGAVRVQLDNAHLWLANVQKQ